jgi:hypothetical protein
MRYHFSSDFLICEPPATNFGDAWELLCLHLLQEETGDPAILRLLPPDRGVDILHPAQKVAYQCKSNERGATEKIPTALCLKSIQSAKQAKKDLGWESFALALNSELTGRGYTTIKTSCLEAGLGEPTIYTHTYWSKLCEKHENVANRFLYYYKPVSRSRWLELTQKEVLYDSIQASRVGSDSSVLPIRVSNNLTPLSFQLEGVSPELTLKELIARLQALMFQQDDGLRQTPSQQLIRSRLIIKIGGDRQSDTRKIGELSPEERESLELEVKFVPRYPVHQLRGGASTNIEPMEDTIVAQAIRDEEDRLQCLMWNSPLASDRHKESHKDLE